MSDYFLKAINKATGETEEILAMDDYFGRHVYGYKANKPGSEVMREEQFKKRYETGIVGDGG